MLWGLLLGGWDGWCSRGRPSPAGGLRGTWQGCSGIFLQSNTDPPPPLMLTVPPVSLGLHNPPSLAREVLHLGAELCPGEMPAAVLLLPSSGARIWDCPWAEQRGQGMLLPSAELAPMPLAPWDAVGAQFPLQRGTPPSCFCPAVSLRLLQHTDGRPSGLSQNCFLLLLLKGANQDQGNGCTGPQL